MHMNITANEGYRRSTSHHTGAINGTNRRSRYISLQHMDTTDKDVLSTSVAARVLKKWVCCKFKSHYQSKSI